MVSIIILSYNTQELLDTCLHGLQQQKTTMPFEIIVVDNASTDGSVALVEKKYKNVLLIKNNKNVGFAKGVNQGAQKAKGDTLFFLNSDTVPTKFALNDAVTLLQNQHIGIVGGALLETSGIPQQSYGSSYTIGHVVKMLFGGGEKVQLQLRQQEVGWVSGGCMLIQKDFFQKLNGFDEAFFMYVEDVELCYRVIQQGKKVLYFPKLAFVHKGHGSSNRTFAIVQIYKGLLYFFKKHRYYGEYILVRLLLLTKAVILVVLGTITGNNYLVKTYREAMKYI